MRRLAGHPHQPLDVADLGLLRQLEDRDVPPLQMDLGRPVEEGQRHALLHDVDPVPRETGRVGDRRLIAAILARPPGDPWTGAAAGAVRLGLAVGVDCVHIATFRAGDFLVPSHQGGCHRAGRDHEALGLDAPEQEPQEHDHERLDRLPPAAQPRIAGRPGRLIVDPRLTARSPSGGLPTSTAHRQPPGMHAPGSSTSLVPA